MRTILVDDGEFKIAFERRARDGLPHFLKCERHFRRRFDLNHSATISCAGQVSTSQYDRPFLIWINFPMTEIIDFTALHRPFKSPRRPARKADLISLKNI